MSSRAAVPPERPSARRRVGCTMCTTLTAGTHAASRWLAAAAAQPKCSGSVSKARSTCVGGVRSSEPRSGTSNSGQGSCRNKLRPTLSAGARSSLRVAHLPTTASTAWCWSTAAATAPGSGPAGASSARQAAPSPTTQLQRSASRLLACSWSSPPGRSTWSTTTVAWTEAARTAA